LSSFRPRGGASFIVTDSPASEPELRLDFDAVSVDVDTVPSRFERIHANGFRTTGYSRECSLDRPDDLSQWRTETQFPIEPSPDE
jgi:hypothetical protein